MKMRVFVGIGMMAAALGACGGIVDDGSTSVELGARATKAPQLNLSHIECTEEGTVLAHFVLLFAGSGQPGALTGTYNGGSFGPVEATKSTGNVWHYNVILPAGEIEILSAQVTTSDGVVVFLHNPGEYSGFYQCDEVAVCSIAAPAPGPVCLPVLGNPGDECGYFGLEVLGKDDNLTGLEHDAQQDAYVVLVKSGRGPCEQDEMGYNIYVNVEEGDELDSPFGQDISHVTYCACPEPQ